MITIDECWWGIRCCTIAEICGFAALIVAVWKAKIDMRKVRMVESFILMATILLFAYGTRETVLQLVDRKVTTQMQLSSDENKAVLQAYQQLSEELNRWFILLVAFGALFGLILPVGSYFLQLRAISRKEDESDERLMELERRNRGEIDKAKKEIADTQEQFAKAVGNLWRSQTIMAHERFLDAIKGVQGKPCQFNTNESRELFASLWLVLKYLEQTKCQQFVTKWVVRLADEIKGIFKNTDEKECNTCAEDASKQQERHRIELSKYCADCMDEFNQIAKFLAKFGINILS